MTNAAQQLEQSLQSALGEVLFGLDTTIRSLSVALITRGHILLQGAPGLGKTLLAKSMARCLGGRFRRIQCTADLMPADIIGVHIFDRAKNAFEFRPGPVFANVVLVDEINRTGPKTQSALLEAMEERQVTIDRKQFKLPEDFMVIATQNPREFEGTFPLPESQLDRFLMRIEMDYLAADDEKSVLRAYASAKQNLRAENLQPQIDAEGLAAAISAVDDVEATDALLDYVLDIARHTRKHPRVNLGLSTRGALALLRCARASAAIHGAGFVTPDDVKELAPLVIGHRLVLRPEATLEGVTAADVVSSVLDDVPVPRTEADAAEG